MSNVVKYHQGADLPDLAVTWRDNSGALIDFSTDYTFAVRVGPREMGTTTFEKSDGITGDSEEPNVTIAWDTVGEINSLVPGPYTVQIFATRIADSKDRIMEATILVLGTLPAI